MLRQLVVYLFDLQWVHLLRQEVMGRLQPPVQAVQPAGCNSCCDLRSWSAHLGLSHHAPNIQSATHALPRPSIPVVLTLS